MLVGPEFAKTWYGSARAGAVGHPRTSAIQMSVGTGYSNALSGSNVDCRVLHVPHTLRSVLWQQILNSNT